MGSSKMRVLTTEGLLLLEVNDADDRSLIGQHHNAIHRAKEGEVSALDPFVGGKISGVGDGDAEPRRFELQTNLKQLKRWYDEGELSYEDIYEH